MPSLSSHGVQGSEDNRDGADGESMGHEHNWEVPYLLTYESLALQVDKRTMDVFKTSDRVQWARSRNEAGLASAVSNGHLSFHNSLPTKIVVGRKRVHVVANEGAII